MPRDISKYLEMIRNHDDYISRDEKDELTHKRFMNRRNKLRQYEGNIMNAQSELKIDSLTGRYQVETEMNVKEGLDKKTKTALQKSIIEETKKRITGGNLYYDDSSSSDEEEEKKEETKKKLEELKQKLKKKKPNKYIEDLKKKYKL